MSIYTFFRGDGWYPLELENDEAAIANALHNPGTVKVERDGKVIWTPDFYN